MQEQIIKIYCLCDNFLRAWGYVADMSLMTRRKRNSKRPVPDWIHYVNDQARKRTDTTPVLIAECFARSIYAVILRSF